MGFQFKVEMKKKLRFSVYNVECLNLTLVHTPRVGEPGSTVDRLRARSSHLWTEALVDSLALSIVGMRRTGSTADRVRSRTSHLRTEALLDSLAPGRT